MADARNARQSEYSVGYQINVAHSGAISFATGFSAPLKRRWVLGFPGPVSYPLIAENKVVVAVGTGNPDGQGNASIYALDLNTGAKLWDASVPTVYDSLYVAYDRSGVYVSSWVINPVAQGILTRYDPYTGAKVWSINLNPNYTDYEVLWFYVVFKII